MSERFENGRQHKLFYGENANDVVISLHVHCIIVIERLAIYYLLQMCVTK